MENIVQLIIIYSKNIISIPYLKLFLLPAKEPVIYRQWEFRVFKRFSYEPPSCIFWEQTDFVRRAEAFIKMSDPSGMTCMSFLKTG